MVKRLKLSVTPYALSNFPDENTFKEISGTPTRSSVRMPLQTGLNFEPRLRCYLFVQTKFIVYDNNHPPIVSQTPLYIGE